MFAHDGGDDDDDHDENFYENILLTLAISFQNIFISFWDVHGIFVVLDYTPIHTYVYTYTYGTRLPLTHQREKCLHNI